MRGSHALHWFTSCVCVVFQTLVPSEVIGHGCLFICCVCVHTLCRLREQKSLAKVTCVQRI